MIILYSKKINTSFKEELQNYLNIVNFGNIECPNCCSHNLIRWGNYERNVIFFSNDKTTLESITIKIQRFKCKSCNKTHALLPFGIIPYKQFTDEVVSKILLELVNDKIENVITRYQIDQSLITRWLFQYNKYHKSKINTLIKNHNDNALKDFLFNDKKRDYIEKYNNCFMQIKLGYLNLCSS